MQEPGLDLHEWRNAEVADEAARLFTAAGDAARGYEAGEASAGDLAHAINCYRELYGLLTAGELDPQQRTPD